MAAQAAAQVFYDGVVANVDALGTVTGNLRRAIYQAYAQDESSAEASYYCVSWSEYHAFYGQFPEFGTAKMAAQPFLRPAYDAARSKAIAAMRAELALVNQG